jgi:YggT family protein
LGIIFQILGYALWFFELVLLARVLLSWFPNVDRSNPIIQFLYDITEPVLRPVRDFLPQTGMMDLSPLVVFLIIQVLMQFVFRLG